MAKVKIRNNKDMLRVFIDGFEVQHVNSLECSRDIEDYVDPFVGTTTYRYYASEARMRVESAYITIEAPVEYTEYKDGNLYIYGPLRRAFTEMFKARELKPWQLDYVKRMPKYIPRSEISYFSDDDIFTTVEAAWFKKGWKAHEQQITKQWYET